MQKIIRHEFKFQHSPALVWEYLTDPELLAEWLMPNDFKPLVGHHFQFKTKPKINFGFDGTVYCEVLEIIPFQKLVYSWKGGMSKEKPGLNSIVTWILEPIDGGTLLKLEHAGFDGFRNYFPYLVMNKGWIKIGKRFIKNIKPV